MKVLIDGQTLGTPEMSRGIGQVFRRLIEGMVVSEIGIDWHIAVRDPAWLEHFSPQVASALRPVLLPELSASGPQKEWCRAYGRQLQQIVDRERYDLYWNPNPLMINVHYPLGLRRVAIASTLHDLIPAVFPEKYFGEWRAEIVDDYRERLDEIAKHAHTLLCVSEHSASDFRRLYPDAAVRLQTASLGADFSRMWPESAGVQLVAQPYILYVGGFDPRKNMEGAVRAFARFAHSLQESKEASPTLRLVCSLSDDDRQRLMAYADSFGVSDLVELTGYVGDDELGQLFRGASIFFFPSLYEGFGLPVLDALASGIPVVASNISSIPEVCQGHAYFCSPDDDAAMATELEAAWRARAARPGPWLENVAHAREFNWAKSCSRYLDIFRGIGRAPGSDASASNRLRIAYLSPWLPQKNGIADYSYALVKEMSRKADITVYTPCKDPTPLAGVTIRHVDDYPTQHGDFDRAIYHIGNGLDHIDIYRHAWNVPGVVVIHDYNVHPFTQHGYLFKGERDFYREILSCYGEEGRRAWDEVDAGGYADIWKFPMTEPLVARSTAAVVHSRWVAGRLNQHGTPVYASHHGTASRPMISETERLTALADLGLEPSRQYIGVFGFINKNKRVDITMSAVAELQKEGYPVSLLLVGEANDAEVKLEEWRKELGLAPETVLHTSFVSYEDFLRYMAATDVIVNLRYPTMGESSGSLFNAFAVGKPCIVSNLNQFAEIPDSVAWKCDLDELEIPQLREYLRYLLENPEARAQMALNAYNFVNEFASTTRAADTYLTAATVGIN